MRAAIGCSAIGLALSSGCSDQVVGYFDDTLSLGSSSGYGSSTTITAPTTTNTQGASSSSSNGDLDGAGSSTGDGLEPCTPFVTDDFDGPALDDSLWFGWAELDSSWVVADGQISFLPATSRHPDNAPADTGLVSTPDHLVPDDNFAIRMEVITAPVEGNQVVLFFMLLNQDDTANVSMRVRPALQLVGSDATGVEDYSVELDEIVAPRWIGMAFLGEDVHYQISDDGVDWTTVYIGPRISTLVDARTLVMVQTFGDVVAPPDVVVDNYSICKL